MKKSLIIGLSLAISLVLIIAFFIFYSPNHDISYQKKEEGSKINEVINEDSKTVTKNIEESAAILVFDLNGDGVATSSLNSSKTFFDLDEDGFKEKVSWINSDDAILFLDDNGNSKVDNVRELFGYRKNESGIQVSGFEKLLQYDDNNDQIIDKNDAIFTKLKLWQDFNQDGISQKNEINNFLSHKIKLLQLSIISDLNKDLDKNKIISTSVYYKNDADVKYDIINLSLAINQADSIFKPYVDQWGNVVDYDVSPETLTLPQSRGYGELHAWNVAMSKNPDLLNKMKEIVNLSAAAFYTNDSANATSNIDSKVEEFIYMWADTINTTGSGRGYDERKLSTLEKFTGETYLDIEGRTTVASHRVQAMNSTWNSLFNFIKERILIQSVFAEEFGAAFYNYTEDKIDYSAVTTADLFYTISEKYEGYKEISDETAFDYLRTITKVMKDFAIGKIDGLDNKNVIKSEFLKYLSVYLDDVSKSIYYKEIPQNPYFLAGYKYYNLDDKNITYCIKNQSKTKIFIANKLPRACFIFGLFDFEDKESNQ